MLIVIDLSTARVTLRDPREFTRFSVTLHGEGDLAEMVRHSGLGRVAPDGEHLVIDPAAVRTLASPSVDAAWEEDFAGMCAYAAGKGWVEADGGIVAHIEPYEAD